MKRSAYLLGIWLLVMGLLVMRISTKQTPPPALDRLGDVPRVAITAVTTQTIQSLNTEDLRGRPWVANFIFTRCGGPCPLMTAKMAALQARLPPEVRLVSFTVDPTYDTPTVLQAYAKRYQADPARWMFVRSSVEVLGTLAKGFMLPVTEQGDHPGETRILHSTRLVLVDEHAEIRAYYDSSQADELLRLEQDVRTLLSE